MKQKRRSMEEIIRIIRQANGGKTVRGVNAIRTTHNPPAPEVLDLCDRMGLLVMDEAFDCWRVPKKPNGYNQLFDDWSERDLRAMIRRDRNHPSIILWSTGNEIIEQGGPEGIETAKTLVDTSITRPGM